MLLQVLVAGVLNLLQKNNRNRILGVFCLLIVVITLKIAFFGYVENSWPVYFLIGGPMLMLFAPLLYVYLLTSKKGALTRGDLRHLFVALLVYLLVHPIRILFFDISHYEMAPFYVLLIFLFNSFYFFKGLKLFRTLLRSILKPYPQMRFKLFYITANTYILLRILVLCFLSVTRTFPGTTPSRALETALFPIYEYVLTPLFIVLCIVLIFYSFTELRWMKKYFLTLSIHEQPIDLSGSFKKSIETLIITNRAYLDPNFNLNQFVRTNQLNQTFIRQYLKAGNYDNFSEFINALRVQSFKDKIAQDFYKNYDFFSIARDCGFRSKATFYRVFRKYEGMTPSEYERTLKR